MAAFDAVQIDADHPGHRAGSPADDRPPIRARSPTREQQLQQQKDSAGQKTQKGRKAANTFIPGTGTAP